MPDMSDIAGRAMQSIARQKHQPKTMKTKMESIDPSWADEVMERHYQRVNEGKFTQRPLSLATVRKYAAEMKASCWKETPVPLIFDINGDLIDGQHRLEAVRMSKRTVRMMVSTGWPVQNGGVGLLDVVDTGRPRTIGQLLHMHGNKSANNIAATVRTIVTIAFNGQRPVMSYSTTIHVLKKFGVEEWIEQIMLQSQSHRDFVARTVGPLCYYYSFRPNKARQLADSIFNFKTDASAVQQFMRWAKNNVGKELMAYIKALAAAIRSFDENEDIMVIKPSTESLEWLAGSNQVFQDQVTKLVPKAHSPATEV